MKRIDMFVFIAGIVSTLIAVVLMLIAINTGDRELITIGKYITYGIGLVIFARFVQDEYFKFKYYFMYVVSNTIIGAFLETTSIFFRTKSLLGAILFIITLGLIGAFVSAFLFQLFKEMSYKKMNRLY